MTIFDQGFFDELHARRREPREPIRVRAKRTAEGVHRSDAEVRSTKIACAFVALLALFLATVTYESVTCPRPSAEGATIFFGP